MAQLLKVIQDPSIVNNVPTTPLEQLQLATERKAAEMAKARGAAITQAILASSPYDVQNDPNYPVSAGYKAGTWANPPKQVGTLRVASSDTAVPGPRGSVVLNKDQDRLASGGGLAFAGEQPTTPAQRAIVAALVAPPPKPRVVAAPLAVAKREGIIGTPWTGGWGAAGLGQTDWSVANQGMGGIGGLVSQRAPAVVAAPSDGGFNLFSLFGNGGGYAPQVGYNGSTTVTSNDLAGVNGGNQSIFGVNAVLPDSMNTKRWITGE